MFSSPTGILDSLRLVETSLIMLTVFVAGVQGEDSGMLGCHKMNTGSVVDVELFAAFTLVKILGIRCDHLKYDDGRICNTQLSACKKIDNHNGDQATRRPHILCSIYQRSVIWGLWRKLYNCSRHHFRARKCHIKHAPLIFLSISNRLTAI